MTKRSTTHTFNTSSDYSYFTEDAPLYALVHRLILDADKYAIESKDDCVFHSILQNY